MRLVEEITLDGAAFVEDGGQKIIRGLVMLGQKSKHGYSYRPEAMKKAINAGVYEGVRLFIDHSEKNAGRSIMNLAGTFRNVRFEDGKIKGDAVLLADACGQKVWDIGKNMPHAAGFSHVADAKLVRSGGESFIEEIREVLSVDLVTTPATTQNMFESQESSDDIDTLLRYSTLPDGLKERLRPHLARCGSRQEREEVISDWERCQAHASLGVKDMGGEQTVTLPRMKREAAATSDHARALRALRNTPLVELGGDVHRRLLGRPFVEGLKTDHARALEAGCGASLPRLSEADARRAIDALRADLTKPQRTESARWSTTILKD